MFDQSKVTSITFIIEGHNVIKIRYHNILIIWLNGKMLDDFLKVRNVWIFLMVYNCEPRGTSMMKNPTPVCDIPVETNIVFIRTNIFFEFSSTKSAVNGPISHINQNFPARKIIEVFSKPIYSINILICVTLISRCSSILT